MIYDICEILKVRLEMESLDYVQTLAGLVTIDHVEKQQTKSSVIEKSFPIYCPIESECSGSQIEPLVPDHNRQSLFYFENLRGVSVNGSDRGYVNYTAYPRLIGWVNPKKLGSENCSITSAIINELISIFISKSFNSGNYSKIKIRVSGLPTKSPLLFAKYKYSKQFVQLLDYPYDYFAIDLAVDYSIHKNCITKFTVNPEIPC